MNFVPEKSALVVVDLQDGIVKAGELQPYSGAEIVAKTDQVAAKLKSDGVLITLVNVDPTSFGYLGLGKVSPMWRSEKSQQYMNLSTKSANDQDVLKITKHNPGAFFGTDLDLQLRRRGIDTIILTGVATGNGVYATALDAFQQGYKLYVVEDLCADRDVDLHQVVINKMLPKMGAVIKSKDLL